MKLILTKIGSFFHWIFNHHLKYVLIPCFLFVFVFADFLANERPIYCELNGESYFPVLHEYLERLDLTESYNFAYQKTWSDLDFDRAIYPLIPFSSNSLTREEKVYQKPGSRSPSTLRIHWLGTDQIGRDVAAGIIHGSRTALIIGVFSMLIATFIGIMLGALSGYFGDDRFGVNWSFLIWLVLGTAVLIFYTIYATWREAFLVFIGISISTYLVFQLLQRAGKGFFTKQVNLPIDMLTMRLIEIFKSIPALFILLALLAIIKRPSIYNIILIIGLLKWPTIARLMRAEMLHLRDADFILASRALAQSPLYILRRHAIPNALTPVIVAVAFGISGVVIIEATISFLGIGLAAEEVTWGSLLSAARRNFSAWWLAIFPGIAIFLTVYLFNSLAEEMRQDKKYRNR